MDLVPADVNRIRELYSQGYYRQAYAVAAAIGPFRTWEGTPARLIGGRLAIQLGSPTLGRRLHLLAFRATPAYPEAIYYHARYRMERFGPLATWAFLRKHPDWSDALPELHAEWLSLTAFIAARLRDFDRAERWLNRAEAIAPDRPWPCIERSSVYELADRLDDALTAARRSLQLHPWFRPGVQSVAHLLLRLGRDHEALEFLTEAESRLESGLVSGQLAALQNDLGHYADARRTLDRYIELSPLLEPETTKWLTARRADTAYFLGEYTRAIEHARGVKDEFYDAFADRLALEIGNRSQGEPGASATGVLDEPEASATYNRANSPTLPPSKRKVLSLELSSSPPPTVYDLLTRFWKHPLPNPAMDAHSTVDGLPDAAERDRAEKAGWITREFTLSLEIAVELIGRGIPFLVALVEAGFSQPRLCVGADAVRGTALLTDGLERRPVEAPIAALVERFSPFGPRGLALVPASEAAKLTDLTFPDGPEREALHAVQKPLLALDRPTAFAALSQMRTAFPNHYLLRFGELAIARFDAHPMKMLAAYDGLLAAHPHEATWILSKAAVLRELNRIPERMALLEIEGTELSAEPLIAQSLAQMLLPHPHRQEEASWLLRRSVRNRPAAAAGYYLLATQWWEHRRFDEAAELYRFACTLDGREDQFAEAYFRATRATDQVPEAVRLFQQKAGRAAIPAPAATRALFHALMDRDEPEQALAALDQAIRKLQELGGKSQETGDRRAGSVSDGLQKQESGKPANRDVDRSTAPQSLGELLLFRAECHMAAGRSSAAETDLNAAKSLVSPVNWYKAAGRVCRVKPDLIAAGAHFLEVVKLDPLSSDAHRTLTGLLTETDGRAAARTHLGQVCQRFPNHYPLLKLRAEFLSGDSEADADRVLLEMLDDCDKDAWVLRQRALVLADRKRIDEAFENVRKAGEIEPDHPWYFAVIAQVYKRADRTEEALGAVRRALRDNIDQEALIGELVQLSRGRTEKQSAL
ncbi:MAG TPA: hypothetical protein VG122_20820, partial [Gemmata sp.]|nr:hypothetical protein [Gemmata sp.]